MKIPAGALRRAIAERNAKVAAAAEQREAETQRRIALHPAYARSCPTCFVGRGEWCTSQSQRALGQKRSMREHPLKRPHRARGAKNAQ